MAPRAAPPHAAGNQKCFKKYFKKHLLERVNTSGIKYSQTIWIVSFVGSRVFVGSNKKITNRFRVNTPF